MYEKNKPGLPHRSAGFIFSTRFVLSMKNYRKLIDYLILLTVLVFALTKNLNLFILKINEDRINKKLEKEVNVFSNGDSFFVASSMLDTDIIVF
jgi:hypothetical protein